MLATLAFWRGCSQQDSHQAEVWLGQPFTDSWGLPGCTHNLICIERARISAFIMGTNHKRACISCKEIHRQHIKSRPFGKQDLQEKQTQQNTESSRHAFSGIQEKALNPGLLWLWGDGSRHWLCPTTAFRTLGSHQDRCSDLTTYQKGAFIPFKVGLLSFENTK